MAIQDDAVTCPVCDEPVILDAGAGVTCTNCGYEENAAGESSSEFRARARLYGAHFWNTVGSPLVWRGVTIVVALLSLGLFASGHLVMAYAALAASVALLVLGTVTEDGSTGGDIGRIR